MVVALLPVLMGTMQTKLPSPANPAIHSVKPVHLPMNALLATQDASIQVSVHPPAPLTASSPSLTTLPTPAHASNVSTLVAPAVIHPPASPVSTDTSSMETVWPSALLATMPTPTMEPVLSAVSPSVTAPVAPYLHALSATTVSIST